MRPHPKPRRGDPSPLPRARDADDHRDGHAIEARGPAVRAAMSKKSKRNGLVAAVISASTGTVYVGLTVYGLTLRDPHAWEHLGGALTLFGTAFTSSTSFLLGRRLR